MDNPSGVLSDWNPDVSCPAVVFPPSTGDAGIAADTSASTVTRALFALGLVAALLLAGHSVLLLSRSRLR